MHPDLLKLRAENAELRWRLTNANHDVDDELQRLQLQQENEILRRRLASILHREGKGRD